MPKTKTEFKTRTKFTKKVTTAVFVSGGIMLTVGTTSLFVVHGLLSLLLLLKMAGFGGGGALEHPYLLFGAGDLENMKKETFTSGAERNKIFNYLKSEVERITPCAANSLSAYGLVYQVMKTKDSVYAKNLAESCKKAMLGMTSVAEWESGRRDRRMAEQILQFALGFDFFYDYLSQDSASLVKIRNKLAQETFKMWQAATQGYKSEWRNWWQDAYSQNHYHRNISSLLLGSLALKYEGDLLTNGFNQTDVNQWITDAKLGIKKAMTIIQGIKDGSWYEGTLYMETTQSDDLPLPLYVLRRLEGVDYIRNDWFKNIPKFYLYNAVLKKPRQRVFTFGDGALGWSRVNAYLNTLRLLASEFGDGVAQWTADQIVKQYGYKVNNFASGTYSYYVLLAYIFYNPQVAATPPEGYLHPSWHAQDLEAVFMRSSWSPENHLIAGIKSGPHGGHRIFEHARDNEFPEDHDLSLDHADQDAGSFSIFYNNEWLANEVPGYDASRGIDSEILVQHNSIDVDKTGQIRSQDHDGTQTQRTDFWNSGSAGISEYSQSKNIDYVVSSAASMYPSSLKLDTFDRHFIFVKPGFFVIVDNLKSARAHTYDWYLHVPNELVRDGNWLRSRGTVSHILGTYMLSPVDSAITLNTFTCDVSTDQCGALKTITGENTGKMPFARVSKNSTGNTRFAGVLYPFQTLTDYASLKPVVQKVSEDENFMALRVLEANGIETSLGVSYGAQGPYTFTSYEYDGKMALIQKKAGTFQKVFLSKGTYVKDGERMLLSNISKEAVFEAEFQGSRVIVSGKNFSSFRLYAPSVTQLDFYQVDDSGVIQNIQSVGFWRDGDYVEYSAVAQKLFLRGDANTDQKVNMTDSVYILNYLFRDGSAPQCFDAADANDNGFINLSDALFLLDYLYRGGSAPPKPGGDSPGPDPTEDNIGCGQTLNAVFGEPYVSQKVSYEDCVYVQEFDRDFGTSLLELVPACQELLYPTTASSPTASPSPSPILNLY